MLRAPRHLTAFALAIGMGALSVPAQTQADDSAGNGNTSQLEASFDNAFGTQMREPASLEAVYASGFEQRIAQLADGSQGRIGVYAVDLATGEEISVLGDQRFPMASTSKVAVAATFLAGVDEGKFSLSNEYPLMIPVRSERFSGARAPVKVGNYVGAHELMKLMISKSCNSCTDALLRVVGGPQAVNKWMRGAGFTEFDLSRDIATLVRDDGEFDPVERIDPRDSATPRTMGRLLAGIYQGRLLSASSRRVLLAAMEETTTGRRRMNAALPGEASLKHKTGTLNRTASDIGIFHLPDGRAVAAAIYVTGQSASMADEARNKSAARLMRDERIATITRALYDGFAAKARIEADPTRNWADEPVPATGG